MPDEDNNIDYSTPFPVLPLRDVVVFPHMVMPLFVGRAKSIAALEHAMENGKNIALVAQHDAAKEEPGLEEVFDIGVLANILQLLKLPDGTVKVLVEGKQRIRFQKLYDDSCFTALIEPMNSLPVDEEESDVAIRTLVAEFETYSKINTKVAPEALGQLRAIEELDRLVDTIAGFLDIKLDDKQYLLEAQSVSDRLDNVLSYMQSELDMHRVEKKIRGRVKKLSERADEGDSERIGRIRRRPK